MEKISSAIEAFEYSQDNRKTTTVVKVAYAAKFAKVTEFTPVTKSTIFSILKTQESRSCYNFCKLYQHWQHINFLERRLHYWLWIPTHSAKKDFLSNMLQSGITCSPHLLSNFQTLQSLIYRNKIRSFVTERDKKPYFYMQGRVKLIMDWYTRQLLLCGPKAFASTLLRNNRLCCLWSWKTMQW